MFLWEKEWSPNTIKKRRVNRGSDKWMKVPLVRVLIENKTTKMNNENTYIHTRCDSCRFVGLDYWPRNLLVWRSCISHANCILAAKQRAVNSQRARAHKIRKHDNRGCATCMVSYTNVPDTQAQTVQAEQEIIRGKIFQFSDWAKQRCWLLERKQTQTTLLFWWMIFASQRAHTKHNEF